jgi:hypothetical protein
MGLPARLVVWCQKLGDDELLALAIEVAVCESHPELVARSKVEEVRDRLDRAQERFQFSGEKDQRDLANVIAELDRLLKIIPTN